MRRRSGCWLGACLAAETLPGRRMFAWSLVTDSKGRWGATPCAICAGAICHLSGCSGAGSAPAPGAARPLASAGAAPEPAEPGQAGCADARAA